MYKFIEKAKKIHGDKYNYSKVNYSNAHTKVIIICPKHGEFKQVPYSHLRKNGCPLCAQDKLKTGPNNKQLFIEKAKKIHNKKYDYSKVEYVKAKNPVTIICPEHGEFYQRPDVHLRGCGCGICSSKAMSIKFVNDTKQFIEKAQKIHGDKYDYSKVEYNNYHSPITIICPKHGEFIQKPLYHLGGNDCDICRKEINKTSTQKRNGINFIKKAKLIHSDKYDYSKVEYLNSKVLVTIICPIHGEFKQAPRKHLEGCNGCKKCAIKAKMSTTNEFIKKAKKIHGDKYNYSKVKYVNRDTDVMIVCSAHGKFKQKPSNHLAGKHCRKCAVEKLTSTTNEFIEKAKEVHDDKYNYSKTNYTSSIKNVIVVCPKHGEFEQTPSNHLAGKGCSLCPAIISSGHQEIIDYIKSISDTELRINDRQAIKPYELDIYLPEHNFAIEYNGIYYHSYNRKETVEEKNKHGTKHQKCLDEGIKLCQILETEWLNSNVREIIKSKIKLKFGMSSRVFARKCQVKEINNKEYKEFTDKYHMQGYRGASVKIGLYYKDELISVMSFNKHSKYGWEITRFVSKLNTIIVGGASKVFKYFIRHYDPEQILTYADRRYSDGNLYRQLGFGLDGITQPNYFYTKNGQIFSRQTFQKHKLKKKLEIFDPNLTEFENVLNDGYRRLWDAGHYRFIWSKINKLV